MLDFSFMGIAYGWLRMKIQVDHEYIIWSCDEALSDPIPGMIRMYNALKEGRDAAWCIERGQELSFHTEFRDGDKEHVWLTVRIDGRGEFGIYDDRLSQAFYDKMAEEGGKEYCDKQIVAEEKFAVDVLLYKFETFFHLLTSSRLYPCHYPCWWYQEDDDSVDDEADKLVEQYPELAENEVEQLELLYHAEHGILTEEGEELYRKFDNMMRTHKVPDGWE